MECFYINLDSAQGRAKEVCDNFSAYAPADWKLTRFSAIDTDYVSRNNIPGSLSAGAKGCFLSHQKIIEANSSKAQTIAIFEDDVKFGKSSFDNVLQSLKFLKNQIWDILFLDVAITGIVDMVGVMSIRAEYETSKKVQIVDLRAIPTWAGATAYIVNGNSLRKIAYMLKSINVLDIPYDLAIRHLTATKQLNTRACFPFVTSLSNHANASQIQAGETSATDFVWNTLRQLVWTERDLNEAQPALAEVEKLAATAESKAYSTILGAMLSGKVMMK